MQGEKSWPGGKVLLRRFPLVIGLALLLFLPGLPALGKSLATPFNFGLELFADGFDRPLQLVDAGDGSGRLFVVEQGGKIRIVQNGQIREPAFLDISQLVSCCGERGLLSVAFAPDYSRSGLLYVDYTDVNGNTIV